jgi:hypothetical protein
MYTGSAFEMRDNDRGCVIRIRNTKETKSFRMSAEVIKRTQRSLECSILDVGIDVRPRYTACSVSCKHEVVEAEIVMYTKMCGTSQKTPSAASILPVPRASWGCCVCRESSGDQVAMPSARGSASSYHPVAIVVEVIFHQLFISHPVSSQ